MQQEILKIFFPEAVFASILFNKHVTEIIQDFFFFFTVFLRFQHFLYFITLALLYIFLPDFLTLPAFHLILRFLNDTLVPGNILGRLRFQNYFLFPPLPPSY